MVCARIDDAGCETTDATCCDGVLTCPKTYDLLSDDQARAMSPGECLVLPLSACP